MKPAPPVTITLMSAPSSRHAHDGTLIDGTHAGTRASLRWTTATEHLAVAHHGEGRDHTQPSAHDGVAAEDGADDRGAGVDMDAGEEHRSLDHGACSR